MLDGFCVRLEHMLYVSTEQRHWNRHEAGISNATPITDSNGLEAPCHWWPAIQSEVLESMCAQKQWQRTCRYDCGNAISQGPTGGVGKRNCRKGIIDLATDWVSDEAKAKGISTMQYRSLSCRHRSLS